VNFEQLFKQITPEETADKFNIFTLLGKDFFVVTAGKRERYNSMVGSGGNFGLLFKKPTVMGCFRSDRYTLELIEKKQVYILSFFPDEYKQQMMFLGNKSGRDSNKMSETELSSIETPSGNISFEEARLIIECKLTQITTPSLDDFYSEEAKDWLKEAYKCANDYRKYVFGEITHAWIKSEN
jgi:flavin reductase (DIM6/NTAB) family NADH-FMN oxidoreductase RutF